MVIKRTYTTLRIFTCSTLLIASFAFAATKAAAQDAYLYIQGDKATPFYVKIDSVMQPRYSKHYCIAPKLHGGKVNVEILFQQNAYPAQFFTIDMPEHGSKGYLLNKEGNAFSLYDFATKATVNPIKN